MTSSPSDAVDPLIERARRGDRAALEVLVREHHEGLRRAATGLTGDRLRRRVNTSDLIQSTILEVMDSIQQFHGTTRGQLEHWMNRILENNVRDRAKFHATARRSVEREASGGVELALAQTLSPSAQAACNEDLERVASAIQRLPDDQQRMLTLRLSKGLSHRECAEILGKSEGACRILLARAKATLVAMLG